MGISVAALTAAVAGAYYLYSSEESKSNRLKLKNRIVRAKADVMGYMEKALVSAKKPAK